MTASHMNRRYNDLIRRNVVHQQADRCDVRNGIHGSHLMEVNLRNRNTVSMALCLCDQAVNCHHILFYLLRKIQMITDDVLNVVEAAVVMMVVTVVVMLVSVFMVMGVIETGHNLMVMVMFMCLTAMVVVMMMVVLLMHRAGTFVAVDMSMGVIEVVLILVVLIGLFTIFKCPMIVMMVEHLLGLFLSMHLHGHMGSADATLAHSFFAEFHAWNPKSVQFCHNRIRVRH